MCRFALYLGPRLMISSLVTEPSNSIIHQSIHSRLRDEPLNGDGFGIAWYVPRVAEPALFKDISPAWNNLNLRHLARVTRTTCLLAHVRAATEGSTVQQLNCHPFAWGPLALMHNGHVAGFAQIRRALLAELSDEAFDWIGGTTDSEHVFALFADRFKALQGGEPLAVMAQALRETIERVEELQSRAGLQASSQLNLVVTDGLRAVVSRYASDASLAPNSLYTNMGTHFELEDGVGRIMDHGNDTAVIVASEPLDDDARWQSVPPSSLVLIDPERQVTVVPL